MEYTDRREEVTQLAEEIAGLCEEGTSLSHVLLRKCYRLCTLAQSKELGIWIKWELQGVWPEWFNDAQATADRVCRNVADRLERTRQVRDLGRQEQETLLRGAAELEHMYDELPPNETWWGVGRVQLASVIERIKNEISTVASDILVSHQFGDVVQGIFEHARRLVDTRLVSLAPDAARELEAAYAQLGSAAEPEELAGAANACRRVLEDLADAIRPVGQGNDYGHDCGSDKYVNRLCAYACEQIESKTTTAVLVADIDYLAARIDTVNQLAHKGTHHKGTHHEFTLIEARMCLIHTYLVVADLLQLARVDDHAEDQGE